MDAGALEALREPTTDDKVQTSLDYLEGVYEAYRAPDGPDWPLMKGRVRNYLNYLFNEEKR